MFDVSVVAHRNVAIIVRSFRSRGILGTDVGLSGVLPAKLAREIQLDASFSGAFNELSCIEQCESPSDVSFAVSIFRYGMSHRISWYDRICDILHITLLLSVQRQQFTSANDI